MREDEAAEAVTESEAVAGESSPSDVRSDSASEAEALRAELETTRADRDRARVLTNAAFEAVCLHVDGRFVDMNRAAETLFRTERTAVLGRSILELAAPEHHAQILERVRNEDASWFEVTALRPDGTTFPAQLRGQRVEIEGRSGRATAVRDLTIQKAAEDALRSSEARFRGLFEGAIDGILILDADDRIVEANPAARTLLRREALAGVDARALVSPPGDDQPSLFESPPQSTREGRVVERRMVRGDGTTVEVEVAAVRTEAGRSEWVLRDLTARKRLEAEQHLLRAELARAQRLEALGRLAGGVAHDFNNLLTVMGLGLESLARACTNEPQTALIREVRGATERAVDLTRRLLALGRRQVMRPQRVDLSTTVDEMAWLLRRMVAPTVELKTALAEDAGVVEVDPDQLLQVLTNLSINARDAMPEGGTLTIATEKSSTPGFVSLSVSDDGTGMTTETVSRAFEPFFTTKRDGVGSGLGLAIVHGIVVQSAGRISVESAVGKGSRFVVLLPEAPVADVEPPSVTSERRSGARIAIVEDDDAVRRALGRVLEKAGHEALLFEHPDAALANLEWLDQVDALVTDVIMPEMRGTELATRLRAHRPGLRVLFISGYTEEDRAVAGDAFLQKPFSSEVFLDAVAQLMRT